MALRDIILDAVTGKKRHYAYRSSITGRFVTKAFAEANKATTYRVKLV